MQVKIKTDVDRISFAVRFADMNVMAARDPELRTLRQKLEEFLGFTGRAAAGSFDVHASVTRQPYPWKYTQRDLHELQRETLQLLKGAVERGGLHGGIEIGDEDGIVVDVVGPPGERVLRFGGSTRSCFILTLAYLLKSSAGERVVKCPECGRIFVRVRRQKYCTPKCTDKATWRNYPEDKKRQSRKKYYDSQGWTLGARSAKKGKVKK